MCRVMKDEMGIEDVGNEGRFRLMEVSNGMGTNE